MGSLVPSSQVCNGQKLPGVSDSEGIEKNLLRWSRRWVGESMRTCPWRRLRKGTTSFCLGLASQEMWSSSTDSLFTAQSKHFSSVDQLLNLPLLWLPEEYTLIFLNSWASHPELAGLKKAVTQCSEPRPGFRIQAIHDPGATRQQRQAEEFCQRVGVVRDQHLLQDLGRCFSLTKFSGFQVSSFVFLCCLWCSCPMFSVSSVTTQECSCVSYYAFSRHGVLQDSSTSSSQLHTGVSPYNRRTPDWQPDSLRHLSTGMGNIVLAAHI